MKNLTALDVIGLTLIVGFVLTSSLLLLSPVLGTGVLRGAALEAFREYFNTVGGIAGSVVGFYFGRSTAGRQSQADAPPAAPRP